MDERQKKEEWMEESYQVLIRLHELLGKITNKINDNNGNLHTVDIDAVTSFLAEILRFIDSIAILFRFGRVETAIVLVRSVFEIGLQLLYLLLEKDKIEEKAACFYVINEAKNLAAIHKHNENKEALSLAVDKVVNISEDLKKEIEKLDDEDIKKKLFEVYNQINFNNRIKWELESWYKFYSKEYNDKIGLKENGKKIFIEGYSGLCIKVDFCEINEGKAVPIYEVVYNFLSKQAHGANSISARKIIDGVEQFKKYDSLRNGTWILNLVCRILFSCIALLNKSYPDFVDGSDINELHIINESKKDLKNLLK